MRLTERGITVGCLPPPSVFGAPAKFKEWRDEQEEGLVLLDGSKRRTSILQMPTGAGKSLAAVMYAKMNGLRAMILTVDKGLEDVYEEDFRSIGLVDVRGANNYHCPALDKGGEFHYLLQGRKPTADIGPCKSGVPCALKDGGCPLYDKQRQAKDAQIVSSNYANWMRGDTDEKLERWGKFDLLVCDEIHAAGNQVSSILTAELPLDELKFYFGSQLPTVPNVVNRATAKLLGKGLKSENEQWSQWVSQMVRAQTGALEGALAQLRHAKQSGALQRELLDDVQYLHRLGNTLSTLHRRMNRDLPSWVIEVTTAWKSKRKIATFQPVWPGPYCEELLFRGVKKIVGMSATVHPYMVEKLGFRKNDFDFWEFDSSFPVENRPVYYFPVAFMRWDMPESEKKRWVHACDQMATVYRDEKGIVHTGSYERAEYYMKQSKYEGKGKLVGHTSYTTRDVVKKFKGSTRPLVLVSPSVGMGWSFDDDDARWQAIIKVQWPDKRGKLMARRCEEDKRYPHVLAMDDIVQKAGRIVRSRVDWGRTIITDMLFGDWYEKNAKQYAAKWFRRAVKTVSRIPRG